MSKNNPLYEVERVIERSDDRVSQTLRQHVGKIPSLTRNFALYLTSIYEY